MEALQIIKVLRLRALWDADSANLGLFRIV